MDSNDLLSIAGFVFSIVFLAVKLRSLPKFLENFGKKSEKEEE